MHASASGKTWRNCVFCRRRSGHDGHAEDTTRSRFPPYPLVTCHAERTNEEPERRERNPFVVREKDRERELVGCLPAGAWAEPENNAMKEISLQYLPFQTAEQEERHPSAVNACRIAAGLPTKKRGVAGKEYIHNNEQHW